MSHLASGLGGALLSGALCAPALAVDVIVRLPDGQPAADAQVLVLGQTGSARTGPDGRLRWVPEPRPPFQLLAILPGGVYTQPVLVESLPGDGSPLVVTVRLALAESVTVEAGSTAHTEAPPANAASIVLEEDLEQRRPPNLTVAIAALPGAGRLEDGQSAVPSLRGLARGRTLLLIDGARVTAERRAGPSATFLDPATLESVEISRGPGSVAWGSDAFGGLIHARTKEVAPQAPWSGRVEGTLGTSGPEKALRAEAGGGLGDGGFALQGRYRDSGDYRSPEGQVANSAYRDAGVRARLDHELGPGRLHASWQSDFGRDIGKPAVDSNVTRAFYPEENSHRVTVGYAGDAPGILQQWSVQGFVGSYRLVTDRDRIATTLAPRQVDRSDVDARDYGLRAAGTGTVGEWRVQAGADLNGRFGLEALGVRERYADDGTLATVEEEASIEDASRRALGAFALVEGRLLSRLVFSGGIRRDHVLARNQGGYFGDHETSHGATSGALAVAAGPVLGTTLTAQASRGFRDPTLSDRYFRGVSGRGYVTGNPDLEPERSRQYDLALRRPGRVRAALYLYRYEIRDLIERYREGTDYFFRNRGRALIRGIELEAQAELGRGFSAEVGAQAAEGRALDDGTPLADIPAEGLTLTLRKAWTGRGAAWVRATLRDRRDDPGPTEKPIPGYGVLDAGGTLRIVDGLEAGLVLGNALDHAYFETPDELGVLAPGLRASLTLSASF
jgi:outer membrane receptor protein involved in Fe transport